MLMALASCKTSEANYRAAYEKTIAAREEADNETIYGAERRNLTAQAVISGQDTIPVVIEHVSAVEKDGQKGVVMPYNVVAGRFKQKFNAFSLRDRLVDAGYKEAFVVQTAEPYYYIITGAYSDVKEAQAALSRLKSDEPVAMTPPVPFILHDPRK